MLAFGLGLAFVIVHRPAPVAPHPAGGPLSDADAAAQVVEAARDIAAGAALTRPTAAYRFVTCTADGGPPYQAAVYMNFQLPQGNSVAYLKEVAAAMTSRGWTPAPSAAEHFGHKLTMDGVTATFYRDDTDRGVATLRLYGPCRNLTDHRHDSPVWTTLRFG